MSTVLKEYMMMMMMMHDQAVTTAERQPTSMP